MSSPVPRSEAEPEQRASKWAIVLLVLVWLGFNYPALAGRVLFPVDYDRSILPENALQDQPPPTNPLEGDAETFYYPFRAFLGQSVRHGDIPLWDPHRFSGTPFAANSQAGAWYPPNWLFAWGNPVGVYTFILVLTRLGGLLLFYWFLRLLRLHPMAAAVGSVVFTASGFLMAWGLHIPFPSSAIWLPLALGGITLALQGQPRRGVPLAAIGLALSILGGHPNVAIYVWIATALWAATFIVAEALHQRSAGTMAVIRGGARNLALAGAPFAVGAGLSAMQVLSAVQFSEMTIRGVEPYAGLANTALPAKVALTLLIPDRFGNPIDGNHVLEANYAESSFYAGIFVLVLAALGLWYRRDRVGAGFTLIGSVGALAALGTPVFWLLYVLVPGLNRLRGPGRFVMVVDVALAGLAALGLDQIIRQPRRLRVPMLGVAAGTIAALVASVTLYSNPQVSFSYLWPKFLFAMGLILAGVALAFALGWAVRGKWHRVVAGGLVALVALDLWVFGWWFHPFRPAESVYRTEPGIDFLASQPGRPRFVRIGLYWIPHNAAMVHGLFDVQGYDAFILRRYVDLFSLIEDQHVNAAGHNVVYNLSSPDVLRSPIADLLGIRFVLSAPEESRLGQPRSVSAFAVFERPTAFPPTFLTPCWQELPDNQALAHLSRMTSEELRSHAIISLAGVSQVPVSEAPCRPDGTATIEAYEPERVLIETDATRTQVLVLTDAWDPNWRATIDGTPTDVLRVDYTLRGVVVPSGLHRVEFQYKPGWMAPAYIVTAVAAAIIFALLVGVSTRLLPRRWRHSPQPSGSHINR